MWANVVELARKKIDEGKVDRVLMVSNPPAIASAPRQTSYQPTSQQGGSYQPNAPTKPSSTAVHGHKQGDHSCGYCEETGLGMHKHDEKWCYVNPASSAYKPDVRERRIKQA